MADFKTQVWDRERIFMVDFGRAPARRHPNLICPDIDRYGYEDDAHGNEHGPIVSARVGQPRVNVRFYRTEISPRATLYAVAADGETIRIRFPPNGLLPQTVESTISFLPRRAGRTAIEIRYNWPDGPVIGRLYVDVRATCSILCRAHIVKLNNAAHTPRFLGENRPAGMTDIQHQTARIRRLIDETNRILEPHGTLLDLRETVESAWTNATLGASPDGTTQLMRAMAHSPNRSRNRINLYFVNATTLPFAFSGGLGPPVAWAINTGRRWPNTAMGRVGSGIALDTNTHSWPDLYLAHEFGHVFSLCRIVEIGANAGMALQWHTTGDESAAGPAHGHASRDDTTSRRRLMYPFDLMRSNNSWRNNIGSGDMGSGALIVQRRVDRDITFEESPRAYAFARIRNNIYAR